MYIPIPFWLVPRHAVFFIRPNSESAATKFNWRSYIPGGAAKPKPVRAPLFVYIAV